MKLKTIYILLIVGVFLSAFTEGEKEPGYAIAKRMFEKTASIKSLTYTMAKQERIDGKMLKQTSFTKMERSPFKVYIKQLSPKEGVEILYVEGASKKALINPNGFPWINIKLDPTESMMRKDQHHTIFQSGFDHVVSILEYQCEKYRSEIKDMITYNGMVTYAGKACYSISFNNPHYKHIDYTVRGNESIEEIAARYKLSEHKIVEMNSSVKDYDDVEAGQVIKIPNSYSPKMLLYIDKEELVPVMMEVSDEEGLYEKYEYSQVIINPRYAPEEFTSGYEAYGF